MSKTTRETSKPEEVSQRLESKKYHFKAEGTMPVLEIDIAGSSSPTVSLEQEHLTVEIYNPMSGEVFEAKFARGRIEVDRDGSMTYFTRNSDKVNISIFLERNISISLNRAGEVTIKSPSKILSVEKTQEDSADQGNTSNVPSSSLKLVLE